MHFSALTTLSAVAATSFLSSEVFAAPSQGVQAKTRGVVTLDNSLGGLSFAVRQKLNPNFKGVQKSGAVAMARVLNKYNVGLDTDLQYTINLMFPGTAAAATNSSPDDTVSAVPQPFDREYLSPVQIGTPPQTLNLDFDTGSADLWVFSSLTPDAQTTGQLEYNPANSSTSRLMQNASWNITYGDRSHSSGTVYTDKVSIGPVTVLNQAVESASQVSSSFTQDTASSGLLGLSFSTLNTVRPQRQKTFFDNAMDSLAAPLFTCNLKKGEAGNYNFGFIDKTEFTGTIAYTPVDSSQGFWGFSTSGFQIGKNRFNATSWKAIADTGTSLLTLPDDIARSYWGQVPGSTFDSFQGGYTYPCANTPPDFTFGIGTYRRVIPGSFMNYASVSSTMCFGGIQSDVAIGFSIFGDIALKAQLVVFDAGKMRLGWAAKPL